MLYQSLINAACSTAWAIVPDKLEAICALLSLKAVGGARSEEEIAAVVAQRQTGMVRNAGVIGVLPLMGTIGHRMGSLESSSGGVSSEAFARDFDRMVNDPSIGAILIDINSPGGTVSGATELSKRIFDARAIKPIEGIVNSMAGSAAIWIGSSVSRLHITPSGTAGSVGIVAVHKDASASDEQSGVKFTVLTSSEHKAEANPHAPLSEDAKENILRDMDAFHNMFVSDLARNRGVSKLAVKRDFGEGRMLLAPAALAAGMVDSIATFDEVVAKLARKVKAQTRLSAFNAEMEISLP